MAALKSKTIPLLSAVNRENKRATLHHKQLVLARLNFRCYYSLTALFIILSLLCADCKKDATVSSDSLYTPTLANVSANATLQELLEGRALYIDHCSTCHGLYAPESYSVAQWKATMSSMGPRTGLSDSDLLLITKYVCMGKQ